ncbi:asparaginase [Pseudahrensia aquimaris]|uniref:Asparaginase n=1 Tax=Pseudahrensia aquimaris TaxID=744461 RepID=A0ABW3FGG1_9HYPH
MTNPILVEVSRGPKVESVHRGAIAVMDAQGKSVLSFGDTEAPVFPRSAVKAIQALPLIESGAADAYGFGDKELSLACSSHSGEDEHVAMARSMLKRAGFSEDMLECGGHWSTNHRTLLHQTTIYPINSTPPAVCNNCSGKHTGFVCTAAHTGVDPKGYIGRDHTIQKNINTVMQEVTGAAHDEDICGTDGCSIPTYAVPLSAMATGFARMATGVGLPPERATAAKRLLNACMNEPFYMAGTKRFCTEYMTLGAGRLFAKTGAEGVFCAAIPELGVGIALKVDDGTTRASEAMMAAVTARLLPADDPLQQGLARWTDKRMRNWNGLDVGRVTATLPL